MNKQQKLARRQKLLYDKISESMPQTKIGQLVWDLSSGGTEDYRRITGNAGMAAVKFVGECLAEYKFPITPRLHYAGMRRTSGSDTHNIDDGLILVHADIKSLSGVNDGFDIPIVVENGKMLPPSIIFHEGVASIIAQSTFDDMYDRITAYRDVPHRRSMFSLPPDKKEDYPPYNKDWPRRENLQNSMFKHFSSKHAAIRFAMTGIHEAGGHGEDEDDYAIPEEEFEDLLLMLKDYEKEESAKSKQAQVSHDNYLDEAERDYTQYYTPGETITINGKILARNRGGGIHRIPAGQNAVIIRDIDGTGRMFYVHFDQLNIKAWITKHQIDGTTHPRDIDYADYQS